ncbi:MAG: Nramp family divalent metal transporter [Mucinivorans sp.]
MRSLKTIFKRHGSTKSGALDIFKYIGPGLLVTVGFIDPGNWAVNLDAGAQFGYTLLWVITLSSLMLIVIQHNAAHLGIATGLCLSEASTKYMPRAVSRTVLGSAMLASVATSMAEILGGAIGLEMLFDLPIGIGALIIGSVSLAMLFTNTYRRTEKWIIAFVSIIGLSFLYELWLVDVDWAVAATQWVRPSFPDGSILVIVSVLGAVVMPHNLFLHSEVIQSRQWNVKEESVIKKQLRFEFIDTLLSMGIGWAINSAMIILAAVVFFQNDVKVVELQQAKSMLTPLLGQSAAVIFAVALLLAGLASSITSAMAGSSIFAGIFGEPFNIGDIHSKTGAALSIGLGVAIIFLVGDPFRGLILSQMFLSIQLPITIFTQVWLTSNERVMGRFKNSVFSNVLLIILGLIVTALNVYLLLWVII